MDLDGARVPVAGATDILGGGLTAEPARRGARPPFARRRRARSARDAPSALDAVVLTFGAEATWRAAEAGEGSR
ncbi:hypothetical protein ABTX99_22330 [Streptomyces flaveolus]|uniref:hypothetical protein n=1 Tax=Streptomyces flaveolus TaxID=67297 RepID=UPI003328ED7F